MTYIENVFACIAAPLLVAALCAGRGHARFFIFAIAGMFACLLSAYVNTFFAALLGTAVVFHGVYNLLASYGGRAQYVAYALPLMLLAAAFAARQLYAGRAKSK